MIKVVIADDEARICRLIQALVDWDSLQMEIVATAENGIEALEKVRTEKPDILITDIRMPGCSGLELIEKAKELCPTLFIIIISGYANFEYAKTAIQYGVSEYLLKPINKNELTDSLLKLKEEIIQKQKEKETSTNFLKDRAKDIGKLRSVLIQDLLENKKISREEMEDFYHFPMQSGNYQAFCVKLDRKTEEVTLELIWEKIQKIMESGVKKCCNAWVFLQKESYFYGILNYPQKDTESVRKMLRDCLNQMEAQKHLFGTVEISMGLGIAVKEPEELWKSLKAANQAVKERLVEGTGKLLEGKEGAAVLYEQKLLDKYARKLSNALELLSVEELERANEELYQSVLNANGVHGFEIVELVQSAGSMFSMQLDLKDKANFLANLTQKSENCSSLKDIFSELSICEKQELEQMLHMREKDSARPVRLAKQYIQNHYYEQITLEEVSEEVGLSPAYFSVLFKKETEVGFAKYLMNVRMEETKIMLRETNLPVAEICRKVGYNDIKHFTHTFEKMAGIKPAVYRKLYG